MFVASIPKRGNDRTFSGGLGFLRPSIMSFSDRHGVPRAHPPPPAPCNRIRSGVGCRVWAFGYGPPEAFLRGGFPLKNILLAGLALAPNLRFRSPIVDSPKVIRA